MGLVKNAKKALKNFVFERFKKIVFVGGVITIEKIKQIRLTNVNTHLISCNSICIYILNRINIFF